jgi:uncharacterized membrane protein
VRIKRLLQSSLGQPNHPFFAFFAVALLSTSLLFDIASYITRDASFARAALYTMAVGLAAALVAIPTGLAWYVDIDRRVPARRVAASHLRLNVVVTALFLINFLWRLMTRQETVTPVGPLVLSIAGVAILMRSGHLGGQLVYHYGIGRQKR